MEAKQDTTGLKASRLIAQTMTEYLADSKKRQATIDQAKAALPVAVIAKMDTALLYGKADAYREAILIQSAYQVVADKRLDLTLAVPGARDCGKRLGVFLKANHISGTKDAYQSIGKNVSNLIRGVLPPYDELLIWTKGATGDQIEAMFHYMAASLSALAKPVKPMPKLDQGTLDFGAVTNLVNDLLSRPSGGAYQQFLVAAFIEAAIEEFGAGGINGFKVDTKSLNATDATSRVAGDVQVRQRGSTAAAFEVTANDWKFKLDQALQSAREGGLGRIHILAAVEGGAMKDASEVTGKAADISVLDVRSFLHSVNAFLQKPTRAVALAAMHPLLVDRQPKLERVDEYVDALHRHGLVLKTR